jgi:hypothetical protein
VSAICVLIVLFVAALPMSASAAGSPSTLSDPTAAQYGSQSVTHGGGDGSTHSVGLKAHVVGGLPFTGIDMIALGAIALALMSAGVALRKLSTPRASPRT